MIRTDFHVENANYEADYAALRHVRETVFVGEQHVPPEIELDALDPRCLHVLARDPEGRPIATGRLSPQGKLGRIAVLPAWRGRGVGEAVLQALVDLARGQGHPMVELHSQLDAVGFYERFAFERAGPPFEEAGIPHVTMRRTLDPFPEVTRAALAPRPESVEVVVDSLQQAQALALKIVAQARRQLWIYTRDLDAKLYAGNDMLEALKRFAIQSRGGQLRILLQDPQAALREAHPLVPLVQRLSSTMLIRVPQEEMDLQYPAAFLVDDSGGYLLRPLGSRYEGTANLHHPGKARQLREYFDQVWERSLPDPELRPIHL